MKAKGRTLTNGQVIELLCKRKESGSDPPMREVREKTLEYVKDVRFFKSEDGIRRCVSPFERLTSRELSEFNLERSDEARLINFFPGCIEEAKALIPGLRSLSDGELEMVLKILEVNYITSGVE